MLFDTDILIWFERGNTKALHLIEKSQNRFLSVQSYMELIQGSTSKNHISSIKSYLKEFQFKVIPLTENIGHRASIYIEEYSSASGLRTGDAIIASTAVENDLTLASGNKKHFHPIQKLNFHFFRS